MVKKPTLKKIMLWAIIMLSGLILLMSWSPLEGKNESTGLRIFGWSGWSALFDEKDFFLKFNYYPETNFKGIDGPYLVSEKIYNVTSENQLSSTNVKNFDSIEVLVNNEDSDRFLFSKSTVDFSVNSIFPMPEKLIAISDIEGNFNAFSSFLQKNEVIDSSYNWIFGSGHLVLVGDFVDRGEDVTQVLWLIYKLELQAIENGGGVHFILGNHEIMNFQGNGGYNEEKYIKIAQEVSKKEKWEKAIHFMYSNETELGRWLRSKNVIEKIGDYLFVHAGLHPEILDHKIDIETINKTARKNWDKDLYRNPNDDIIASFIIGRKGPFWYRGLVTQYKYYSKIEEVELDRILSYYDSKTIVVGHTVVQDISKSYDGKVIRIDLLHGKKKYSGLTKGLLIKDGIEYIIDDAGNKEVLI